jgi:hypothetical protein
MSYERFAARLDGFARWGLGVPRSYRRPRARTVQGTRAFAIALLRPTPRVISCCILGITVLSTRLRSFMRAAALARAFPGSMAANSCNRLGILELSECADCERPDLPKRPRQSSRCKVVRDL